VFDDNVTDLGALLFLRFPPVRNPCLPNSTSVEDLSTVVDGRFIIAQIYSYAFFLGSVRAAPTLFEISVCFPLLWCRTDHASAAALDKWPELIFPRSLCIRAFLKGRLLQEVFVPHVVRGFRPGGPICFPSLNGTSLRLSLFSPFFSLYNFSGD